MNVKSKHSRIALANHLRNGDCWRLPFAEPGLAWMGAFLCAFLTILQCASAENVEVESARHHDPEVQSPTSKTIISPKFKPVWLEGLRGPEVDLKRQAADTIARAHKMGMPGLADTVGPLMELLDAPDQDSVVQVAAVRALVSLDAREAAPLLFEHAQSDCLDVALLVEPVLANWDYQPIREVWLKRLSAPRTSRRRLSLAIRGLAAVGEISAAPKLQELCLDPLTAPEVRIEAARALGDIRTEGLENLALPLAVDKSPGGIVDRLVSASLVRNHGGEDASTFLVELAEDPEPSVAAIALERLLQLDPSLIVAIAEEIIANPDANVRHFCARALVARPTPGTIGLLGPMLDDPHPDVRRYVRLSLVELASDARFLQPVLDEATEMLATERWRGLEQSSLLLVSLDHKPAAPRLVELLDHQRPEVFITAAWALRRLAVPATLDAMFDKVLREIDGTRPTGSFDFDRVAQLCHLLEAFGQMKCARSEALLREHIPKKAPFPVGMRAAAIWALGYLYSDEPQPDLARLLAARLADINPLDPEEPEVRQMSAVSIGRMKSSEQLGVLRKFLKMETVDGGVGYACGWAIEQITGEPMPKPSKSVGERLGWFLEPLD